MLRHPGLLGLVFFLVSSTANAEVYDVANQTYDFTGIFRVDVVGRCGPVSKKIYPRTEILDTTLSIQFGEDEEGGLLQVFADSVSKTYLNLPANTVIDNEIVKRKKNKLFIQRSGAESSLEGASAFREKFVNLCAKDPSPIECIGEPVVKRYSNQVKIKKEYLKLTEKITISAPVKYQGFKCTATLRARRILYGVPHIEP